MNVSCRLLLMCLPALYSATALTVDVLAQEAIDPADPALGRPVDFYMDVYPILEAKCLACHSSVVKESDLILENAESI
ncbi:MAG: hypothetical protein KDA80_19255, partial [Planctomycetaceae bacterium]|nr:hypothetical protein [Planctomycetaceae bacterium]